MVKYRLVYFNAKGKAEVIRYIFAYVGQEYEDFRFEKEDWHLYKPKTILGQVPVLELTEGTSTIQLAQSIAIARYLANEYGLAGSNALEKARADMIVDQLVDLSNQFVIAHFYETDEKKRIEKIEKFYEETFAKYVSVLDRLLEAQRTLFMASDKLTWADLAAAAIFDALFEDKVDILLQKYELVATIVKKVSLLPQIIDWRSRRPATTM